ncbi:MAG TPA: hypothetical protein VEK08_04310 [Planctomycetota bacterium]|nr:hypothetical protein [Planctomycetota bacterium]
MKTIQWLCILAILSGVGASAATTGTPTQGDSLRAWFKIYSKEFKRLKSKELLLTGRAAADVMLDGLSATGLVSATTRFSALPGDVQTALTRLKTDLETLKDKIRDTDSRIGQLVKDLNAASKTGTPPDLEATQLLVSTCYAALNDGELADKDRQIITETSTKIAATAGLTPTIAQAITADVAAILAGVNATKVDVDLIKTDFSTLGTLIKAVP